MQLIEKAVQAPVFRARRQQGLKILLIMRLTVFLLLAGTLCASAEGYTQNVTLRLKNATLEQTFREIQRQTGYSFLYTRQMLENAPKVSISLTNVSLKDALNECLKQQPLEYSIENTTVIITRRRNPAPVAVEAPPADTLRDLSGVVLSENGTPLQGATVKVIGLNKMASANASGGFVLNNLASGKYKVEISFVGYEKYTASVEVQGNTVKLTAVLKQSLNKLDEIQVVAYGTTTKRFNTGSTSTLKSEDIEKQPVTNLLAAIQGRMPGVQITSANGIPGSGITMQIRGINSISALSNPLYIVDGIPFPATTIANSTANVPTASGQVSPFNSINPLDIESVSILKDADATAIYGSRGANGVVLITTKKGKAGKTKFDFNMYSGSSVTTRVPEFMSTQQFLDIRKKAFAADNITPTKSNAPDLLLFDQNSYTNFPKLILGNTAPFTNAQASLSGGNEYTRFLLGMGYHHEGSVIFGDNHDNRVDGHFNIDHNSADKKLNVNMSVTYSNDNIKTLATDPYLAIYAAPNYPHYDSTGALAWVPGDASVQMASPWSYLNKVGRNITDNFMANMALKYSIISGLSAKVNVGFTKMFMTQQTTYPTTAYNPTSTSSTKSQAFFGNSSNQSYIAEPQLEYTRKIGQAVITALAGGTAQSSAYKSNSITGINFTSNDLIESISAAATITNKTLTSSQYKYISGFSRLNFRWMDKYLFNASFRRDGSSRFGPGKKFGNFWSVSGGWIFSEEKAVKNIIPALSFGKLRASYGLTGNDQINDYRYLETYTSNQQAYNGVPGLYSTGVANPLFHWEDNRKLELALELGFLKDRILFTSAYYRNRSNSLLVQTTLPSQTGSDYYQGNLPALVQNTSWEFELSTVNINHKDFRWQSSFNITIPKNTLLDFPGLASSAYASYVVIGKPLQLFRGYHFTGISSTTGVPQFEDVNKDGSINSSGDYTTIGSLLPKFYGGFGNTFSYKGFSLDLFVQFASQNGYNALRAYYFPVGYKVNLPVFLTQDYWTSSNPNASRPGLTTNPSGAIGAAYLNQLYASTAAYSDASYLRLKNLSFSYTLPRQLAEKIKAQNVRLYVQGQNLFTISPYQGLDPEVQNATPVLKTLTGGIQITF